jgi:hypothetical protein
MATDPDFVEIPLGRAQAFGGLISAARSWRGSLVPSTSTALWGPTKNLLEAIAALDPKPCDHPRSWRVFRAKSANADEVCGYCGTIVVGGLTESPDPGVVSPTSPSPTPSDPET